MDDFIRLRNIIINSDHKYLHTNLLKTNNQQDIVYLLDNQIYPSPIELIACIPNRLEIFELYIRYPEIKNENNVNKILKNLLTGPLDFLLLVEDVLNYNNISHILKQNFIHIEPSALPYVLSKINKYKFITKYFNNAVYQEDYQKINYLYENKLLQEIDINNGFIYISKYDLSITPLYYLVIYKKNIKITYLLLESGANIRQKNIPGRTNEYCITDFLYNNKDLRISPYQYVRRYEGYKEYNKLLRKYKNKKIPDLLEIKDPGCL